jgi:predicted nucleic acid binding AN1-type Zn finger protein
MKCPKCTKKCTLTDIMQCKHCEQEVCLYCRLPETHECAGLEQKKNEEVAKLEAQLKVAEDLKKTYQI